MRKKIKIFLLIIILIIAAFSGGAYLGVKKAHKWFQSDEFETYVQSKLNEYGNIHLAFGDRTIRFFPIPKIVVKDVDLIIADKQRVSIPNLSFTVNPLTLFSETPVIDSATVEDPVMTLIVPDIFAPSTEPFVWPDIPGLLQQSLSSATNNWDVDDLEITNGTVNVKFENPTVPEVMLWDVEFGAYMRSNKVSLELNAKSSHFEALEYTSDAHFADKTVSGSGKITQLALAPFLPDGILPSEEASLEDVLINTRFSIKTGNAIQIDFSELDIEGTVVSPGKKFPAVFAHSVLTLLLEEHTIKVLSQGINGVSPKGRLTADISIDLQDTEKPHIDFNLDAYNINIKESGSFLGSMDSDAAHIFDNIVQDGIASEVHFSNITDNFDDIFRYSLFNLKFVADDATVNIFPIRLVLQNVSGVGGIKGGILTLTGASGEWRTSSADNCELWLDLNSPDYDFTYSSNLDFDISGLQELLPMVNPRFYNILLDRMENLSGRANCTLDIKFFNNEETITAISQTPFEAKGTYKVGNLPIHAKNAMFSYADGKDMQFSSPDASLGKSRAVNLTYTQDLREQNINTGHDKSDAAANMLDVDLEEMLPVITDLAGDATPQFLRTWKFTSGELVLTNFKFNGVINNTDTWAINSAVNAKTVSAFNIKFAEEPFTSPSISCNIKTAGDRISFSDIDGGFDFAKDNRVIVHGGVFFENDAINLDLDISAPKIDFDLLLKVIAGNDDEDAAANKGMDKISGTVDFNADTAILFERAWSPVKASATVSHDKGFLINLEDVALCGIDIKGHVNINDRQIDLKVTSELNGGDMQTTLPCLSKDITYAEGDLTIKGTLNASGDIDKLWELMNGDFVVYSSKGRFMKFTLLSNLLSIVNVTEFYKGSLPNFHEQGFDYSELRIDATITNGIIKIEETEIDSSFFTAVAGGTYDMAKNDISIDILVAPFKTVDRLISYIPIIGHIMGNNLVALPFRASGPISDPVVTPLPPDAVAGSLLGILERTLTAPFSIFDNALFDLFKSPPPSKDPNVNNGNGSNGSNGSPAPAVNQSTAPNPQEPAQPAPNNNGKIPADIGNTPANGSSTYYGLSPEELKNWP